MYYSQGLKNNISASIKALTRLFGVSCEVYYPESPDSIKGVYSNMNYPAEANHIGKLLLMPIFKTRPSNLSVLPFPFLDDDNAMYTLSKFPIGSLIVAKTREGSILNFTINGINTPRDDEKIFYYKYSVVPYTIKNSKVSKAEIDTAIIEDNTSHPNPEVDPKPSDVTANNTTPAEDNGIRFSNKVRGVVIRNVYERK